MKINHQTSVPINNKVENEYSVTIRSEKCDYYRELGLDDEVTPKLISSMLHNALSRESVEGHGTLEILISKNE